MKLKKMNCFNDSRFRVLVEDFFALTVIVIKLLNDAKSFSSYQFNVVINLMLFYISYVNDDNNS